MNQKVRMFLIDQCIKEQPIYYEAIGQIIGLDLDLESQPQILSKTFDGRCFISFRFQLSD